MGMGMKRIYLLMLLIALLLKVLPIFNLGDGIHNFADGIVIAASFLIGFSVGLPTTTAVIFLELPIAQIPRSSVLSTNN